MKHAKAEFNKYSVELVFRFLVAIALGLGRSAIYMVFSPLTLHFSYILFSVFVPSALIGNKIATITDTFTFVPACTASSAYLLLAFLILLTKDIKPLDRLSMFVYGSLAILAFNLFRIELLLFLYFKFSKYYPWVHIFFWKFVSTAFVALLWVVMIKCYKVRSVPVYSDLKYIIGIIRKGLAG